MTGVCHSPAKLSAEHQADEHQAAQWRFYAFENEGG